MGMLTNNLGFPGGSAGKESTCNVGDLGSIPGLGRSPEEGNSYPFQYSGLENSMDCIVHGVAMSQTWLSDFHFRETRDYGRSCQATLWYCYCDSWGRKELDTTERLI